MGIDEPGMRCGCAIISGGPKNEHGFTKSVRTLELLLIRSGLLSKRGIRGEEDGRGGGDFICGGAAAAEGGAMVGW